MPKQIEYAKNIHSAGTDLLALINDILDLSKIESGTVTVEPEDITFFSLRDTVHRTFHHIAENKQLSFNVDLDSALPRTILSDPSGCSSDPGKNLLSNAFKFTAQGYVHMAVRRVTAGWSPEHPCSGNAAGRRWRSWSSDTGISIAAGEAEADPPRGVP